MKTTLELPDELMREVKLRAVREDRTLKDMVAYLLRRGLAQEPPREGGPPRRVRLPLVQCAHQADPAEEVTPERAAALLLDDDAAAASGR